MQSWIRLAPWYCTVPSVDSSLLSYDVADINKVIVESMETLIRKFEVFEQKFLLVYSKMDKGPEKLYRNLQSVQTMGVGGEKYKRPRSLQPYFWIPEPPFQIDLLALNVKQANGAMHDWVLQQHFDSIPVSWGLCSAAEVLRTFSFSNLPSEKHYEFRKKTG